PILRLPVCVVPPPPGYERAPARPRVACVVRLRAGLSPRRPWPERPHRPWPAPGPAPAYRPRSASTPRHSGTSARLADSSPAEQPAGRPRRVRHMPAAVAVPGPGVRPRSGPPRPSRRAGGRLRPRGPTAAVSPEGRRPVPGGLRVPVSAAALVAPAGLAAGPVATPFATPDGLESVSTLPG